MNNKELKSYLDKLYFKYKDKHSSKDPVWILHEFQDAKDIEIAGLITSCYAYGRVDQINIFIKRFLKNIDFKVHEFTSNYSEHKDKKYLAALSYRFNTENDLSLLLKNINNILNKYQSLQDLFVENYHDEHQNILEALDNFTLKLNEYSDSETNHGYLIPLSKNRSTCKRLNLFLRWMIRKDEIDIGIWEKVDMSKLIMPVDTHIYRVSRKLKMVKRNTCDLKFALELTDKLRKFDQKDPVKYDFALCHAGMEKAVL
ncbi:MAG TPA: TIGR02757 family protein [Ignavibacteria bacterium]|nr:TIGR02757 family protein [Ignavibacteria bacterium]HMR41040.1 TIGR02757 family protein [Ignavibacteria bacterium]